MMLKKINSNALTFGFSNNALNCVMNDCVIEIHGVSVDTVLY